MQIMGNKIKLQAIYINYYIYFIEVSANIIELE